jgi:hypothetical protein
MGVWPYGLRHLGLKDAAPIYVQTYIDDSIYFVPSLSIQLVLKVKQQFDSSCCWVCHGRFHDIVPQECPGAFYDVPQGLYKGMSANNHCQSDGVTHTPNI